MCVCTGGGVHMPLLAWLLCGVDSLLLPLCVFCGSNSRCQLAVTITLAAKLARLFDVIIFEMWMRNVCMWVDVCICTQVNCVVATCPCLGGGCKHTYSSSVGAHFSHSCIVSCVSLNLSMPIYWIWRLSYCLVFVRDSASRQLHWFEGWF